jgi:hypothetical protein
VTSGWDEYDKSKVAAPTGYDTSIYGASKSPTGKDGSGRYSQEIAMSLLFFDEIQRLSKMMTVPTFDMGPITEVLGKGKFKIKLSCLGTVITATAGILGTGMISSSQTSSGYVKGDLALVLMVNSNPSSPNGIITYSIVSVRKMGAAYNVDTSTYPV